MKLLQIVEASISCQLRGKTQIRRLCSKTGVHVYVRNSHLEQFIIICLANSRSMIYTSALFHAWDTSVFKLLYEIKRQQKQRNRRSHVENMNSWQWKRFAKINLWKRRRVIKCEDLSKRHILNKAVATLRALYKSLMDLWSGCEQFREKRKLGEERWVLH